MDIYTLKDNLKGYHFAWIGQNATTGDPHPLTGNMSMYGRYLKFKYKDERDDYVYRYYDINKYAVGGSLRKMREYSLGNSLLDFYENLDYLDELRYIDGNLCAQEDHPEFAAH